MDKPLNTGTPCGTNKDHQRFLCERLQLTDFDTYKDFPLYYEIETVNACNARCRMCTINKWQRHKDPFMPAPLFQKIAAELICHANRVRTVNLSRDGEPLLDKSLEDKIAQLKQGGISTVTFSTNASLLDERRAARLLASPLDDIMFSIDGSTRETFEQIRAGLRFDMVVANVKRFIDLRNKAASPMKIRVRMVLQPENAHEAEPWGAFWRSRLQPNDGVHAKALHSWANQLDAFQPVTPDEKLTTPCTSPFSTMIIRYNGDVTICPLDYDYKYINGNLAQRSIEEVWQHGAHFTTFRKLHLLGERDDFDFCRGCRLWEPDIKIVF